MKLRQWWMRASPIDIGVLVGLLTGLADTLIVQLEIAGSRGEDLPTSVWLYVPSVWITFCAWIAVVFSLPPLRRFAATAIFFGGPGLLLIARGGPILKRATQVSLVSATVLSVCLAAVLAVLFSSICRADGNPRLAKKIWFALVPLALLLLGARSGVTHGEGLSAAAPADPSARNVVLVFLDTLRYDDAQQMPNLAKLAATASTFENAWAPEPWTLPSHFAVFTGLDPWQPDVGGRAQRFASPSKTLAQQFLTRGYATGAVFANPMLTPQIGFTRGFQLFQYSLSCTACRSGLAFLLARVYILAGKQGPVCARMLASDVTWRAASYLASAPRPYFLALNYLDAHDPYYVEARCAPGGLKGYSESDWQSFVKVNLQGASLPHPVAQRIRSQYRAAVRCLDNSLGALFDAIRRQPDSDRTIVAIVADHGEQFGEHGLVGHGNSVYSQVLHVPLVVRIPDQAPKRVLQPVSITDLYSTLLEAANVPAARGPNLLDGHGRLVIGRYSSPRIHGYPPASAFCVVGRRYHLIRWENGREEGYAYVADPSESSALEASNDSEMMQLQATLSRQWNRKPVVESGFHALGYLH